LQACVCNGGYSGANGGPAPPAMPASGACTAGRTPAHPTRNQAPCRRRSRSACATQATTGTSRWAGRSSRCARYALTHTRLLGVLMVLRRDECRARRCLGVGAL
jgi:hypothetical protein